MLLCLGFITRIAKKGVTQHKVSTWSGYVWADQSLSCKGTSNFKFGHKTAYFNLFSQGLPQRGFFLFSQFHHLSANGHFQFVQSLNNFSRVFLFSLCHYGSRPSCLTAGQRRMFCFWVKVRTGLTTGPVRWILIVCLWVVLLHCTISWRGPTMRKQLSAAANIESHFI